MFHATRKVNMLTFSRHLFTSLVYRSYLCDTFDKDHCNHHFSSFFVVGWFLESFLWSNVPPIILTRVLEIQPFLLSCMGCLGFRLDVQHQYATVLNLLFRSKFKKI